ncbi:UNVERIFIED_CONTAM: hypothetical protein HDU68_011421 [Siphonaria sp. JEL0065]|nr:hypothetical protein HDU68_011421 [Siphonaria sp. JEL0065]
MTLVLATYNSISNATLFATVFTLAKPKVGTNPKSFVVGNVVTSLFSNPTSNYNPATCGGASYLNLDKNWQIQLPYSSSNTSGITVIGSPTFQSFASSSFYVNTTRNAVQFYTANTGITTPGSNSPRTELRQMNATSNGTIPAKWSAYNAHSLNVTIQVDHVPVSKFLIFTQIVSNLRGAYVTYRVAPVSNLTIFQVLACAAGKPCTVMDPMYKLGSVISLSVSVFNKTVTSSYANGASKVTSGPFSYTMPGYKDLSFKLGSYCGITTADLASYYCQVSLFSATVQ